MLEEVLVPEHMSSDEPVYLSDEDGEEVHVTAASKKLVKKRAGWRSEEFQGYIESLDRKIVRKMSERVRRMCLPEEEGEDSVRHAPINCPPWAKTVFD